LSAYRTFAGPDEYTDPNEAFDKEEKKSNNSDSFEPGFKFIFWWCF